MTNEYHLDSPSYEQLAAMLDNAPIGIFVSDLETRQVLYMNRVAKESLPPRRDQEVLHCYQVAGQEAPCCACAAGQLRQEGFLCRDTCNPLTGRDYCLNGKKIDWNGRPAHLEYVQDVTETKREQRRTLSLTEELQETFSNVPCGLCVYRYDGTTIHPIFHNPAFFQIIGHSPDHVQQVEEQARYLDVHPQDVPELKQVFHTSLKEGGRFRHTCRIHAYDSPEYRHIAIDGQVRTQEDGTTLLYCVYTDISQASHLQTQLTNANRQMQEIINAIPGGVAIYRVSDMFETVYFSDGVPHLSGYTPQEYQVLIRQDAANLTYPADRELVVSTLLEAIETGTVAEFDFRKLHRDGHIVWVHIQARPMGEDRGAPLLHCVFHNITALKETQLKLDHLVNSIPGGIASYQVKGGKFIPTYFSDGLPALSGHSREEFAGITDAMDVIYPLDRARVVTAALAAMETGQVLDVSYRMRHKQGHLIWVHLNGRRMGPLGESSQFYAVFTGMTAEARLFQGIAAEAADGIYVVDASSYELLYVNESKPLLTRGRDCMGMTCYATFYGRTAPCVGCPLAAKSDEEPAEFQITRDGRHFSMRFRRIDWNGLPAYVQYVQDVTEEVLVQQEKERLELYFQNLVTNLPGGVGVIHIRKDGTMTPEFLSEGFATMTDMDLEAVWDLYATDATAGIHPDDHATVVRQVTDSVESGQKQFEMTYRLRKGRVGYLWVKATFSILQVEEGECLVYGVYQDITQELRDREQMRRQYEEMILQHYRNPNPHTLLLGHCNITEGILLDMLDHTGAELNRTFGMDREAFFMGISGFIPDPQERQKFRETFLKKPALEAFAQGKFEVRQTCFVHISGKPVGMYVQILMHLVATPDSDDVTGILSVTDITEETIAGKALRQLSSTGYDFLMDLDLDRDQFSLLSWSDNASCLPPRQGAYESYARGLFQNQILPKDREACRRGLQLSAIRPRLEAEGTYTVAFSLTDPQGDIRTKSVTVSAVDLRLGRVGLFCTDITASVREQQGLLRTIAHTFELLSIVDCVNGRFTMYTRRTVLENLPPYDVDHLDKAVDFLLHDNDSGADPAVWREKFQIETMLAELEAHPQGYDLLIPSQSSQGERFKQINVLWGDVNHKTICLLRADVTEMLAAERQTKRKLEQALALAEEANRAKSDFLSTMSHDIRTPMNAIMGMTALARAHLGDREKVENCLEKISISSKHLLSIINDILDMSKIEQSQIPLNRMKIALPELLEQLAAIMIPQAKAAGLQLNFQTQDVTHPNFYGDALRINQILINILGNAIKFTPEGGRVDFLAQELPSLGGADRVRFRFTIRDTGIGMPEAFLTEIFHPFTRSLRAARIEGTGLGLSITKGLVDMMQGEITVESKVNQGSAFQVTLEFDLAPAEPLPAAGPEQAADEGLPLAGMRFLVAEDNAINAEILCGLLELHGASAVVTVDGAKAVQAFQAAPPGSYHGVLMDVQMPEMNGHQATRAIRALARPDAKTIPIIAMTANAFAEDVQASLDAGMTAHIAKPIDMDALLRTLTKLSK